MKVDWSQVETVLLDMDGVLLDRHFDDHFFLVTVPKTYAAKKNLPFDQAKEEVLAIYKTVEGTLAWYDLDHWTRELDFDIPLLKHEVEHLIGVHPHVLDFLDGLNNAGLKPHLVTNAHARSLALKMSKTRIGDRFATILTSHDLGKPKEDPAFWGLLQDKLPFDPASTLLVEDSESVLISARTYGLGHLLHVATPSSNLAPTFSEDFPSIADFREVMPIPANS